MASRRKARELALQMLFQWELGGHSPQHVVSTFLRAQKVDEGVASFALALFEGTVAEVEILDRLVQEHSEHWRLERMPAVDRNLLRVALYELRHHPETPPAVIINEALEIARRFSDKDAVDFVNGVLDAIRKSLPVTNPAP
jgi:N utilization substance protein B